MADCSRFADSAEDLLLAQEQGRDLDPDLVAHIDSCAACTRERDQYALLRASLDAAPDHHRAPADAQARIFARIARREEDGQKPVFRRLAWLSAAAVAAAAAWFLVAAPAPPQSIDYNWQISGDPTRPPIRGDYASPGDTLKLRATVPTDMPGYFRLYRGARLRLSCGENPPCRRSPDAMEIDFPLDTRGDYQALLFTGVVLRFEDHPGELQSDIAAAEAAGATVKLSAMVRVR